MAICILTISEYCTKWVEAIGTTTKEAINVANSLFKVNLLSSCIMKIHKLHINLFR